MSWGETSQMHQYYLTHYIDQYSGQYKIVRIIANINNNNTATVQQQTYKQCLYVIEADHHVSMDTASSDGIEMNEQEEGLRFCVTSHFYRGGGN